VTKILVVDDEPNIREVVGQYLRRDGYEVVVAADGEEALEQYRRSRPDLVVLDLMLPKKSGLEVCRRLGAEGRVPLIMLTARGEEEDRIVGLSLGADDYVVKPAACCSSAWCWPARGQCSSRSTSSPFS
jgi:DNA-binding response OmpR family regulator